MDTSTLVWICLGFSLIARILVSTVIKDAPNKALIENGDIIVINRTPLGRTFDIFMLSVSKEEIININKEKNGISLASSKKGILKIYLDKNSVEEVFSIARRVLPNVKINNS